MAQGIMRVRTVLTGWQGGPGLATHYFQTPAGDNNTTAATAGGRVRSFWDVMKGAFPTAWSAQVQDAVDLVDPEDGSLLGGLSAGTLSPVVGTSVNPFGFFAVGYEVRLETGAVVDGRRLRGRSFCVPAASGAVDNGKVAAGVISLGAAGAVALIGTSPTTLLKVWHRPKFVGGTLTRLGSAHTVTSGSTPSQGVVLRSRRD